jgi:hypothetical protein
MHVIERSVEGVVKRITTPFLDPLRFARPPGRGTVGGKTKSYEYLEIF